LAAASWCGHCWRQNLIDRYLLLIFPLVLGQGRRLFDERGPGVDFELVDSVTTSKGVIIASYQPR
jgi:dihydrofolate reductase